MEKGTLLDQAAFQALKENASMFNFYGAHARPSEMHRLRNTDFNAVLGNSPTLFFQSNGAVWYATLTCRRPVSPLSFF